MSECEVDEDDGKEREHFATVLRAFDAYGPWAYNMIDRHRENYAKLGEHHQELLGLDAKVSSMREAVQQNARLLSMLVNPHRAHVGAVEEGLAQKVAQKTVKAADMDKLMSTLKQFVREWGAEGAAERAAAHNPLLEALQRALPDGGVRGARVLVPGAGLGRLAWEVAARGYQAQGNEFSYFMLLASNFVLNSLQAHGSVTVHPWVHQTCNVKCAADQVRGITIPDVAPWSLPEAANLSVSAGDFLEVYRTQRQCFESVLTCFFIDTAHNLIEYLAAIRRLLTPGGAWVNLGPLLWHFSDDALVDRAEVSIDLTWEEVRKLIIDAGFILEHEAWHRCPYVRNPKSMYMMEYDCICFIARWPHAGPAPPRQAPPPRPPPPQPPSPGALV